MPAWQQFFSELRRRHVFKVAAAYGVVAWLVIQVAATTFPILDLPLWTTRLMLALAVLGAPLALVLAWSYELTPDGVRRTRGEDRRAGPADSLSLSTRERPAATSALLPFVGREKELREVTGMLADPAVRLVSVVGPGGMGKTRLAMATAEHQRSSFSDGVAFVPLDGVVSEDRFLSDLADAVGVSFYSSAPLRQQFLEFLRGKEILLVLDGFEGLLHASVLLTDFLGASERLRLLVTSRERLELQGEHSLFLEGLGVPFERAGEPEQSPAMQLFIHAARRRQSSFELPPAQRAHLQRICRLLEGMPLGLELAAGWVDILSVEEIAREIENSLDFLESRHRDIANRHRSIRAVVDSSWSRLASDERRTLASLAVFQGGFSAQAAREVAGARPDTLADLVSKALVHRVSGNRFHLHRLLRSSAEERLRKEDEAAVRRRHALFFLKLVSRSAEKLGGSDQQEALDELQVDFGNVADAWSWAVAQGEWGVVEQMLEPVHYFCDLRSRFQEAESLFAAAVGSLRKRAGDRPAESEDAEGVLLGRLLARQGYFSLRAGQTAPAVRLFSEGIERLRKTSAKRDLAFALNGMGDMSAALGRYTDAERFCERALAIFREFQDRRGMAASLNNLGVVAYHLHDYGSARGYHRESLQISRELGDQYAIAFSLNNLGVIAHDMRDYPEAEELYGESLAIAEALGDRHGVAAALVNLGRVAQAQDQLELAMERGQRASRLYRELGDQLGAVACAINLGDIEMAAGNPAGARPYFLEGLQGAVRLGSKPLVGEAVVALAAVACESGKPGDAFRWLSSVRSCSELDSDAQQRRDALWAELSTLPGAGERSRAVEPLDPVPVELVASEILSLTTGGADGQDTSVQAHRS